MFVEGGGTRKKFLQKGEVLFNDGEPGEAAFIVDSGAIGIYKLVEGEEVELAVLNPGELFGEMAIVTAQIGWPTQWPRKKAWSL